MSKKIPVKQILIVAVIPGLVILLALLCSGTVTVWSEQAPTANRTTVIIDAGHGGPDGGAISCTGIPESHINLEISLRLNDLFHLLGIRTVMIRTEDQCIASQGNTIAQKKISDLKHRVKIVNEIPDSILVSIHQNYFTDSRYFGGQIFYAATEGSEELAKRLQTAFVNTLNPGSKRLAKPTRGVYLMDHIRRTGILVECGFLSNPAEEEQLRTETYQKKLCCVIAAETGKYITSREALDLE